MKNEKKQEANNRLLFLFLPFFIFDFSFYISP